MKQVKFLFTLFAVASAMSLVSCKSNNSSEEAAQDAAQEETVQQEPAVPENMIFSNSYDGFTNIRTAPSSSSPVVAKFFNGRHGALVIEEQGKWIKVNYNGVEGYVYAPITSRTPTIEVTVDISSGWLWGEWLPSGPNPLVTYTINANGTFEYGNYIGVGYLFTGNWHLEGNELVLIQTWNNGEFDNKTERMTLDGAKQTIIDHRHGHLDTSDLGA